MKSHFFFPLQTAKYSFRVTFEEKIAEPIAPLGKNFLTCLTQFCAHFSLVQITTFISCSRHFLKTGAICLLEMNTSNNDNINNNIMCLFRFKLANMEEIIKRDASKTRKRASTLDYFPVTDRA